MELQGSVCQSYYGKERPAKQRGRLGDCADLADAAAVLLLLAFLKAVVSEGTYLGVDVSSLVQDSY